jgi:hypothetical protein
MNEDEALRCLDIASAAIKAQEWSKVRTTYAVAKLFFSSRQKDLLKRVCVSRIPRRLMHF